ncbi:hypothetical protein GT045_17085, partial [Streptomyces sp. SID486]|uniref:hypothetical protein n=1 Tax=Streptomyces sp. SID486 TaxID=2690264 RepID=UPI00136A6585
MGTAAARRGDVCGGVPDVCGGVPGTAGEAVREPAWKSVRESVRGSVLDSVREFLGKVGREADCVAAGCVAAGSGTVRGGAAGETPSP